MRYQIAPLPDGQVPQIDPANPHPLQACHVQADLLAHAPDLAFFALPQDKKQLLRVLPADLRGRSE
jgi:hypothetical protein